MNERDPVKHAHLRKLLSHGFSPRAMADQEDAVQMYIDKFILRIGELETKGEGVEMVKWYNFLTFDIIGM